MLNAFECRVKYTKIDERTGKEKKVSETYLIDAVSFTEAEERINREMEAFINGDFLVTNVRKVNFSDIIGDNGCESWFKVKVALLEIDDSGKQSKVNQNMLVLADNTTEAADRVNDLLKNVTIPYEITSITKSKIVDVFLYEKSKEEMEEEMEEEDENV